MTDSREVVFHADRSDFRVDTYVGTGPGGQHRNRTSSCVRITHIATGLTASCCESRSQHQNRKLAFQKLVKILVAHVAPEREKLRNAAGTVVVRTYHAVDNRVKDHASGATSTYAEVLDNPDSMIEQRRQFQIEKTIQEGV